MEEETRVGGGGGGGGAIKMGAKYAESLGYGKRNRGCRRVPIVQRIKERWEVGIIREEEQL